MSEETALSAQETPAPVTPPATEPVVEVKKPEPRESARFAELARRQRELTQKQLEIKQKEEQFTPLQETLKRAKENPLAALEALGMTYEDLTHFILTQGEEPKPEDKIAKLEERLNAKELAEKQAQERAENERVERTISSFKETIVETCEAAPEQYELILASGDYGRDLVFETVSEYFEKHKSLLPLPEALAAVESYLEGEALKVVQAQKIKAKLLAPEKDTAERNKAKVTLNNGLVSSAASAETGKYLSDDESKKLAASLLKWS